MILPVWHGIDQHYLAREAPMLANRLGVSTHMGIPHVVEQLTRALAKELRSETAHGNGELVLRSALTSDRPRSAAAEEVDDRKAGAEPVLVLAPPSQHRLNDPHRVTSPSQVIWAQSAVVDVENVGTAVAFIRSGGADPVGAGAVTVKPPTAIAPDTTRPVELVVSTMSADVHIAAGQLVRFWLDYGSGEKADRRLWAIAQYNAGGGWTNIGSDNRPLV